MIVFISDLHFVDETAGKQNVPTSAFKLFLSNIKTHSEKTKNKEKELKIVFLGDIFDLLRTEEWFHEKEEDMPWGNNTENMKKRAKIILDKIAEKNKDTFNLFSKQNLENTFKDNHVETIYIPGNHDRLCWMIGELKEKVIELLGLSANNAENFKHYFSNSGHGVYATHGHIFDKFNYEGGPSYTDSDYRLVPIGDPITTEILTKIPYKLIKNIELKNTLSSENIIRLKYNFREIGNIRPFYATLKWLLFQINENIALKEIIEDTIDEVMVEFNDLKFVKNWYKHHDKWYQPFDTADMIQACVFCLEKFKIFSFEKLSGIIEYIMSKLSGHNDSDGAIKLFRSLSENIQYVVMGHTHFPSQQPLFFDQQDNGKIRECLYLNTGTWIKNYYECREGNGFIGWKNINYVIVYTPEEKPNKYNLSVFETWRGVEKRDE
ncbi:metallophosphoesterase [bacterium]|nr:metallophosphoesterase [bacterium]MBU4362753.1 metallophosphoesterase [bacterium]MBU4602997.1 metallophosphoesterase [bacterium]MCG2762578.1 metallophosphoesterase [Candidatus Atribacteria bacterium]